MYTHGSAPVQLSGDPEEKRARHAVQEGILWCGFPSLNNPKFPGDFMSTRREKVQT
jgi:hypothetical protein